MLCVENVYIEVMYVTLSLKLHSEETSDRDRDIIHHVTRHCTSNMI